MLKPYNYVFPIGMYEGETKPTNVDLFMFEVVDEMNALIVSGVSEVVIKKGKQIMDSPARSLIHKTKQAPGYFCCHKCWIEGIYKRKHRTISFIGVGHPRRTHEEFSNKTQFYEDDKQNSYHNVGPRDAPVVEKIIGKIF